MAQVPNVSVEFEGDGTTVIYDFDFPYQTQAEVFVSVDGAPVPYVWVGGSTHTVQITPAPAVGAQVVIYRSTLAYVPKHVFAAGVPFLPRYVDENNRQFLYTAQEAIATSNAAQAIAAEVRARIAAAEAVADDALDASARAETLAQEAADAAAAAVEAAGNAVTTADGIAATADEALVIANAADAKADEALAAVEEAGVASFNGRSGIVLPIAGDYNSSQITTPRGTLEADLASLEGRLQNEVGDVAELRTLPGRYANDRVYLRNYLPNDHKGGRWLTWVLGSPRDDAGMYFSVTGVITGYWLSDLDVNGRVSAEFYGMPLATGANCYAAFNAMYLYCLDKKQDMYCGAGPTGRGRYNFGSASCPISGARNPNVPFTTMDFGMWTTRQVTFETLSNGGADVFNLCSIENFFIRGFAKINGTVLTPNGSGSNGVSMVFGARNVLIELDPEDMPVVYKVDGGTAGGHGFTVQYGTGNTNIYDNVVFRGRVRGCTSGFNMDFSPTNTVRWPNRGIYLDNVYAENCYRGCMIGGTPPSESVIDPATLQPYASVSGRIFLKNCQQSLLDLRSWGTDLDVSVLNTVSAAELVRHPYDNTTEVVRLLASKRGRLRVAGRILDIGTLVTIGGAAMSGNAFASLEDYEFDFNVSFTTAVNRIVVPNPTSIPALRCILRLWSMAGGYSVLATESLGTTLYINGSVLTPTKFPADETVQAAGGAISRTVYTVPLATPKSVNAPSGPRAGDIHEIIRTASSTGSALVPWVGANIVAGTTLRLLYTGSVWITI